MTRTLAKILGTVAAFVSICSFAATACPELLLDPGTHRDAEDFLRLLAEHPLSRSVSKIHAESTKEDPTADPRLAKFLAQLHGWRDKSQRQLALSREDAPVWIYPGSGYDLATMVAMVDPGLLATRSAIFILVDPKLPFVITDVAGKIPDHFTYGAEDLYVNSNAPWADSVTHKSLLETRGKELGGILPATLSRMKTYFGAQFSVHNNLAYSEVAFLDPTRIFASSSLLASQSVAAPPVHGQLQFRLGTNVVHSAFFIHGTLASNKPEIEIGDAGQRSVPLAHPLLQRINGLIVRGSQGLLSPRRQENAARNVLLTTLARNRGILYEGLHQNPQQRYHEPDPDPEVTPEIVLFQSDPHPRKVEISVGHGKIPASLLDDREQPWSYYPGARAIRF